MPIPDEVKAGIEFLNEQLPNWQQYIELDKLDLGICERCILGQLFGTYYDGVKFIGVTNEKAEQLGLFIPNNRSFPNDKYSALTAAWKEALS